jgi:hypothetical protein
MTKISPNGKDKESFSSDLEDKMQIANGRITRKKKLFLLHKKSIK